jgi:hypothetical protein
MTETCKIDCNFSENATADVASSIVEKLALLFRVQHHYKHLYNRQKVLYPKQPNFFIYEETDIDDESGDSESDIMSSVESDFELSHSTHAVRKARFVSDCDKGPRATIDAEEEFDDILSRIYPQPASTTSYEQLDIREDQLVHNHPRIGFLFKVYALISGLGKSTDTSQKNAQNQYMRWPEEPRSFVWRHMLENNFYSRNPQGAKLEMLVEKLKAHLRIQCTQAQCYVIFERVRLFVRRWTGAWLNDWGLIHKTQKGVFSRVDQFEPQWRARYESWMASQDIYFGPVEVRLPSGR